MSDPYHCRWCGRAFVVPSLTVSHQDDCPMKRDEGDEDE